MFLILFQSTKKIKDFVYMSHLFVMVFVLFKGGY